MNYENGEYQISNRKWFPWNLDSFEKISGIDYPLENLLPTNPEAFIEPGGENPNLYAVIISGGIDSVWNAIRYWNNMSAIFCTLTQVYGYMPENIYVHSTDGTPQNNHGSLDLDRIGPPYVDDIEFPAYKSSIENTFQTLANEMGPEDQLFIYVTDHGDVTSNGESFICLWGTEKITSSEFEQMLSPINAAEIMVLMGQCFSGGFITNSNNITGPHRVIQTASAEDEPSHLEFWLTGCQYDEFVFYWTAAARGYYPSPDYPWELGEPVGTFPFENYFPVGPPHPPDYDPDTNGDGRVQMQEALDYANNWDTWSPYGYYNPLPGISDNIENPQAYHNTGFEEDLLTLCGLSGNVVESQMVSGNFLICGDLTVAPEAILTIEPASLFNLPFHHGQGASLKIMGSLIAQGTETDSIFFVSRSADPDQKGIGLIIESETEPSQLAYCSFRNLSSGIQFNYRYDIQDVLDNCYVACCNKGVEINYSSPTIEHCNFSNNNVGIELTASSPQILANTITSSSLNGIYFLQSSGNVFGNSAEDYQLIENNGISESTNSGGIYCFNGSSPVFEQEETYGYNQIRSNFHVGLIAQMNCSPILGNDFGHNSIHANTDYEVIAINGSRVIAQKNWWGTSRPTEELFFSDMSSYIDYSEYLEEDPFSEGRTQTSKSWISNQNNSNPGIVSESGNPIARGHQNLLSQLLYLYKRRDWIQFKSLAYQIFSDSTNANREIISTAITLLSDVFVQQKDSSLITKLQQFPSILSNPIFIKQINNLRPQHLLLRRKFKKALQVCENNLNSYPDTLSQVYNYYVQFRIYLIYQDMPDKAREVFNILNQRYPNHSLTYLAALDLAKIEGNSGMSFGKGNIITQQNVVEVIPKVYQLSQNYPNPFNPVTTIRYQLPKTTKVKLDIYNILGQKIKALIDARQPADYYMLEWNGKNDHGKQVGSGLYIYRLIAEATDGSENFVKVKKMLLIR